MMLLSIVKKDFLLVKRYMLMLVAFVIVEPILVNIYSTGSTAILGFFMTVIMLEYVLNSMVWQLEDKYKGSILLCTSPYTRKTLVKAKYLFVFVIFICSCIIYSIVSFIAPVNMIKINIFEIGISLLIVAIFFDIVIPALYRFGFVKLRNILVITICIIPITGGYISKWLQSNNINFKYITSLPSIVQNLGPYVITLIITLISMTLSINIYSKKDL